MKINCLSYPVDQKLFSNVLNPLVSPGQAFPILRLILQHPAEVKQFLSCQATQEHCKPHYNILLHLSMQHIMNCIDAKQQFCIYLAIVENFNFSWKTKKFDNGDRQTFPSSYPTISCLLKTGAKQIRFEYFGMVLNIQGIVFVFCFLELVQSDVSIAPSGLKVSFVTRNAVSLAWNPDSNAAYYTIMMKPVDNTSDFQSYGPNARIPFPQADIGDLTTGKKCHIGHCTPIFVACSVGKLRIDIEID